jgi:hypothetical protein
VIVDFVFACLLSRARKGFIKAPACDYSAATRIDQSDLAPFSCASIAEQVAPAPARSLLAVAGLGN